MEHVDIGAASLSLPSNSYDLISAMDVLFHITDDAAYDRALTNLSRLLRPGGLLVFSDNFLHGPTLRIEHQVSRLLEQIQGALDRASLRVVTRVRMFALMNAPVDSHSRAVLWLWRAFTRLVAIPGVGYVAGALLYRPEIALTSLLTEGPSTELMVCRSAD